MRVCTHCEGTGLVPVITKTGSHKRNPVTHELLTVDCPRCYYSPGRDESVEAYNERYNSTLQEDEDLIRSIER